jgi:hypothetical protein
MTDLPGSDTSGLVAVNVVLAALVVGAVLAVLVAVVQDVLERRRMRASLPDSWPTGSDDKV